MKSVSAPDSPLTARTWRAPQADRTVLADPPAHTWTHLAAAHHAAVARRPGTPAGHAWADLLASARAEILAAALARTRSYRDVADMVSAADTPWFVAGHQPQLFHPGVWIKNFALDRLARAARGIALNLIVDGDLCKSTAIRVPGGTPQEPQVESIPFDTSGEPLPYEERRILSVETWRRFAGRVGKQLASLLADPLIHHYWPLAQAQADAGCSLGEALARSRHQLEATWGLQTLELPQSAVSNCRAAHGLIAHLLADAHRFRDVHNRALVEFRHVHRIRSASHPVPALAAEEPWVEAPFWVWQTAHPRRRRLFAAPARDHLLLTDRAGWHVRLPAADHLADERTVTALGRLEADGIKLRTRALTTTMLARLLLADLFVHGIGGGLYDRLTDLLMARYWHLEPPPFAVLTATLRLPISGPPQAPSAVRSPGSTLRELRYHPERYLSALAGDGPLDDAAARFIAEKRAWIARQATPETARQRCRAIRAANEALQPWLAEEANRLAQAHERQEQQHAAAHLLADREYAFCLYPAPLLQDFLLAFRHGSA